MVFSYIEVLLRIHESIYSNKKKMAHDAPFSIIQLIVLE